LRRAVRCGLRPRFLAAGVPAFIAAFLFSSAHAKPTVFRIFNLGETTAYVIQRNSNTVDTEATSSSGVFSEPIEAAPGDRIVLLPNDDLAPPVPPVLQSAHAQGSNCVRLAWTPTGDVTVVGYVISWGFFSVERGQATEYRYRVETGPINSYDLCGLAATTYYFSVQAINYVGQVSAYSQELSIEMVTTPVLISRFDARADRDAVRLSWDVTADEVITAYRIYRRGPGTPERVLADALPPSATSYADTEIRAGTTYTYVLAAIKQDGSETRSAPASAITPSYQFALHPSAPNPFHQSTRVPFTLDTAARVTVRIYNVRGALVATLFDGTLPEGRHEVGWGGHDLKGNLAATGTYFCTLTAGKAMRSQKILLLR
jgi:hypothetical protein